MTVSSAFWPLRLSLLGFVLLSQPVLADDQPDLFDRIGQARDDAEAEGWLVHGQLTYIQQWHPAFRSPYAGGASFNKGERSRETLSFGPVLGRKLWEGAEIYLNPEWDQGYGLGKSVGVAGFPNNEAFRVGTKEPRLNFPRLFIRQTIGFGGPREKLDADQLQFAEEVDVHRLTITAGKVSVWDIFDDNKYSHDPRTQFMNWALVGAGAVDYAADAKGYTNGVALDYNRESWAARIGAFQVARTPNGKPLDGRVDRGWQLLGELEERFTLFDRPGKLKQIGMLDRTRSITYAAYPNLAPVNAGDDLPGLRRYRVAYGFGLNLEQELADDLGFFSRLSWNPGKVQEYMFTEIDQSASAGFSLKGTRWGRGDDTVGLAGIVNGLSDRHKQFYQAGNIGFIVGDGRMNYRPEKIAELYYDLQVVKGVNLAFDYQFISNPGYNVDRGPVSVFGLRLHSEF